MFNTSVIYFSIAIIAFVIILVAPILQRKKTKEISRLSWLAITLVLIGGAVESRLIGYTFIAMGVLITAFEFIKNRKQNLKKIGERDQS